MAEEDEVINISPQEDKGLRRVYHRLCDFSQKEKLRKEIHTLQAKVEALSAAPQSKQAKAAAHDANVKVQQENKLNEQIQALEQEIARLENNPDKKIKAVDVWEHLKFLGKKCTRKEVTDIVWEVDENLDGMIDWDEFKLMFFRNINDHTGLEPAKLYNMVQFMLYDVDNNVNVSVDETMNMLYARQQHQFNLTPTPQPEQQGGEIGFLEYLEAVERTQLNTFVQSSAGRAQLAKTVLSVVNKLKKRPFLVGGVATASVLYLIRRSKKRFPEGEIWLDIDLSQPLANSPPGIDLSFLSNEPQPLYFRDVVDALEMAANDEKVKGVMGRFSYRSWGTGGGCLACVQEVRDAVTTFRYGHGHIKSGASSDDGTDGADSTSVDGGTGGQPSRKFTIAVADTFGEGGPAIGEYFLASAFEKILVQKSGYVGLMGIAQQKLFFRGFFDKYGIKPEMFAREEYKNAASSLVNKAYSKHERKAMTSLITSILDDVADAIVSSRGFEKRKDVYDIMQDCPLPAKLALSAKLIDGTMYQHDVESMVKNGFKVKDDGDAAAAAAKSTEENVLSAFIAPEGEDVDKCTRVSIQDYIRKMKEKRATQAGQGMFGAEMLPGVAKGAAKSSLKTVALIHVNGAITRSDGGSRPGSKEGATSRTLCKRLQETIEDPTVAAVVIRVDSPGGSAVASDSIASVIRRIKAAGKPVVCSMGDLAASGGYMIASACDTIVAQPTTITGSIGVIALKLSVQRLLKDWGINVDSIEISQNDLAFSPFQEFTPKQRSLLEQRVGEIYEDFVVDVAAGRKLSVEEVYKVAKGRVWTGRQALDRGLVDQLGGLNSAIAVAKTAAGLPEDAPVVGPKRKSLAQVFGDMASGGSDRNKSGGSSDWGVRTVLVALADSVIGAEAMDALFAAVSVLASANDLANGKNPSRSMGKAWGEVKVEVDLDDF
eukprot:g14538.t1